MTRIVIVRHGETDWNAEGRVQGHTDVPLNDAGRRQAESAARALQRAEVAAVYASDLERAAETGRIIAQLHGLDVRLSAALRERNLGVWQGHTLDEVGAFDPENLRLMRAGEWFVPEGGETFEELRERVVAEVRRIAAAHEGQTVVVATHGGPVKVATLAVLQAPFSAHTSMRTENAGLTTFLVRDGRFVLEAYNVTSHIQEPLPTGAELAVQTAL